MIAAEPHVAAAPGSASIPIADRGNRLRILVALVGLGFGAHLLLLQLGDLPRTLDTARRARWAWLLIAALAYVCFLVASGVALWGAAGRVTPLGRTAVVQLPAIALGRLTPVGAAGLEMQASFLARAGLDREDSVAAVTATEVAGFVLGAVGLGLAAGLGGWSELDEVRVPDGWPVLLAVAAGLVIAGVVLGRDRLRSRAIRLSQHFVASLRGTFDSYAKASALFGGTAAGTLALVLSLTATLHAFRASAPFAHVVAAYLVAVVVGTLSPTPGGIGALEAALVAGLTRAGMGAAPAVASVLGFRLLTFWLPILPALIVAHHLRRRGAI